MDVIVCLDERGGMSFGGRRQSRDREVIRDIMALAAGRRIWLAATSAALFPEGTALRVVEAPLAEAPEDGLCFVEDGALAPYAARIRRLHIYRWHRHYPADRTFDLVLDEGWRLVGSSEFRGYSHDCITREDYER